MLLELEPRRRAVMAKLMAPLLLLLPLHRKLKAMVVVLVRCKTAMETPTLPVLVQHKRLMEMPTLMVVPVLLSRHREETARPTVVPLLLALLLREPRAMETRMAVLQVLRRMPTVVLLRLMVMAQTLRLAEVVLVLPELFLLSLSNVERRLYTMFAGVSLAGSGLEKILYTSLYTIFRRLVASPVDSPSKDQRGEL